MGRPKGLAQAGRLGLGGTLLLVLSIGCTSTGITRDRAIELALAQTPGSFTVVSAEAGRLDAFVDHRTLPVEPRDRQVWAVLVSGTFEGECVVDASGEPVCPGAATRMLILLDVATGAFVASASE